MKLYRYSYNSWNKTIRVCEIEAKETNKTFIWDCNRLNKSRLGELNIHLYTYYAERDDERYKNQIMAYYEKRAEETKNQLEFLEQTIDEIKKAWGE